MPRDTPARLKANRKNARSSTGPRTRAGKVRASKNAWQHGLSIPLPSTPALEAETEALARMISGESSNSTRHEHARAIAKEIVDLRRIQRAKELLFLDVAKRIRPLSRSRTDRASRDRLENRPNPDIIYMLAREAGWDPETFEPVSFEQGAGVLAAEISRFDRYADRALARRRRAIEMFDLAGF